MPICYTINKYADLGYGAGTGYEKCRGKSLPPPTFFVSDTGVPRESKKTKQTG